MGHAKDIFLKDVELAKQLQAVVHAEWFQRCLIFTRSELMDSRINTDHLLGARMFEQILLTLADEEQEEIPTGAFQGLEHNLEQKSRIAHETKHNPKP